MRGLFVLLLCILNTVAFSTAAEKSQWNGGAEYTAGINLAGAEWNAGWPSEKALDYWKSKGITLIRLPFAWELLQPTLKGDFEPKYAAGLKNTIDLMKARNMQVILDVHNYGKFKGKLSTPEGEVPYSAFADLWLRLAKEYKDYPNIWGYGLMNETYVVDPVFRQMAIDAIRSVDKKTRILVSCDGQVRAYAAKKTPYTKFNDPADNIWYEKHTYFDNNDSGKYKGTYDQEKAYPEIAVERLEPFYKFLKENNLKGMVGEFSVPDNDPRWLVILDNAYKYMQEKQIISTYWAGGERWTPGHSWVIDPIGWKDPEDRKAWKDRPQLEILMKYLLPPSAPSSGK